MSRALNATLAVVLFLLCVWLTAFAVKGTEAAPGRTPVEEQAQELRELRRASQAQAVAFLTIDYRRMDTITDRVLAGSTGTFHREYKSSVKALKQAAIRQKSLAKGYVKEIGIGTVDDDSATVFVAAGSKVRNEATEGKVQDRTWRMKFDLTKRGDRWLVSQLEFVS